MQPSASTTSSSETVVRILVLGGNGMMGSDFVYRVRNTLEKKHAGTHRFEITTLNRGNHYWDSEDRVDNILDKKIICGRKELKHCGQEVFGSSGKVFDFVVDTHPAPPLLVFPLSQLRLEAEAAWRL